MLPIILGFFTDCFPIRTAIGKELKEIKLDHDKNMEDIKAKSEEFSNVIHNRAEHSKQIFEEEIKKMEKEIDQIEKLAGFLNEEAPK